MLKTNESLEEDQGAREAPVESATNPFRVVVRGVIQFFLMLLVLFLGFAGMNHLTSLREEPPTRPPFQTVYPVDSVIAQVGSFQPDLLIYGEVQAAQAVELRALVSGQIIEVNENLKVGGKLEKGDELLKIDPFVFETELASARANLRETLARIAENRARIEIEASRIRSLKDQLKLAENDLERISALKSRGTATSKQVEDRTLVVSQRRQSLEQSELNIVAERSRLEQMEAVLERFQWAETQALRNISDTVLKAPVTGIISEKNAAVGRLIGANDMVVSMYAAGKLEVRFTLTDERFGRIQSDPVGIVGRNVEVIWSVGGEEFRYPATIDRISAQITSSRGGVEVIATINDAPSDSVLRPGAFVEIIVPDKTFDQHYRLPESALYGNETVYEIVDRRLESRKVRVHARDGDYVIVTGSIENGAEILATRIAEISDGIRVQTSSEPVNQQTGKSE